MAVEVLQPDTPTTPDGDHREVLVILHLGAGVPEDGEIAGGPVLVRHRLAGH
jgi:hypothetical protein